MYEDLRNEALKENPSGGAFTFTDTSSYWSLIEGYFVTAQHTHCSLANPAHDGSCLFAAAIISFHIRDLEPPDLHAFFHQCMGSYDGNPRPAYDHTNPLFNLSQALRNNTVDHIRHLYITKSNRLVNDLTQDLDQQSLDTYLKHMTKMTTPATMLEVAALADVERTPIEILRQGDPPMDDSLVSFSVYLPSGYKEPPFRKPKRSIVQLLLSNNHFQPLIANSSAIWPDEHIPTDHHLRLSLPPKLRHPVLAMLEVRAHTEALTQKLLADVSLPLPSGTPGIPRTTDIKPGLGSMTPLSMCKPTPMSSFVHSPSSNFSLGPSTLVKATQTAAPLPRPSPS